MWLYRAARDGPGEGAIVEIGSWKGKSTIWLAAGSKAASREPVFAIDPHTGSPEHGKGVWTYPEFMANLEQAGLLDHVVPMVMRSERAAATWSGPIRLLWIDGAHEFEAVKRDFDLWVPHVVEGGVLALHDTIGHFAGPKRVATQLLRSNMFHHCGIVGITTYGYKTSQVRTGERVGNYSVLILRSILEVAGRR